MKPSHDEDIELAGLNGPSTVTPVYARDDNDESEDEDDIALLGSQERPRETTRTRSVTKLWPQISDIVVEVLLRIHSVELLFNLSQSAPTLLLTTVGLLFTGELLDHVSVRQGRSFYKANTDISHESSDGEQ